MTRKIILIASLFFIYSGQLLAGDCDDTIDADSSIQYGCSNEDTLTVNSGVTVDFNNNDVVDAQDTTDVTIVNNGTIQNDGNNFQAPIDGEATRNLTITNGSTGTINATKRYGIYIEDSEQVTITNRGTIKTTYEGTATNEQGAIYGNNIGNCASGNCYNSSDSNGGEGLTLNNYGTITSYYRTIWGGNSASTASKNITINNYDGGSIASEFSVGMRMRNVVDFDLYNYSGATIETGTVTTTNAHYTLDLQDGEDVYINNAGTIKTADDYGIACKACTNSTIINSGTIQSIDNYAIFLRDAENVTVENSGTITADGFAIFAEDSTSVTITNSGTISSSTGQRGVDLKETTNATVTNTDTGIIETATQVAINANGAINPTITNRGTLRSTVTSAKVVDFPQTSADRGTGGTLENFGTIINATGGAGQSIRIGDGDGPWNNLTIMNSGTISSIGESIYVQGGSDTSGLNIITKDEGTYIGEIDMESAAVNMTLDCSISKDQDIEIEDKTNMVVINNLCGGDTYEILDSSKNSDPDNSETNGYLRIYGEDLDIVSHNKKFRTEIFLTKLRKIFNAASYDREQTIFDTNQKRKNIYKSDISGVVGYFNPEKSGIVSSHFFMSYANQNATFENTEFSGSKNLSFGYRKEINNKRFTGSVIPIVGLTRNKVSDLETETNERLDNHFFSQFAALDAKIQKQNNFNENNSLTLEVQSTFGMHSFPDYITTFGDGDLSVDDAIDQVLGAGFSVKYLNKNKNGFVIEPYLNASYNNTFSNDIQIIADSDNKEAGHIMNGVLAMRAGLTLTKHNDNISFSLNLEHGDQDGLKENTLGISFSKKIQRIAKLRMEKLRMENEKAIPELEKLYDQLQLVKENERLRKLAGEMVKENTAKDDLIIQLLKENQKLKLENKIIKNNLN